MMSVIENLFHTNESPEMLESICNNKLKFDPKIRSAAIINDKGRLLTENKRKQMETL